MPFLIDIRIQNNLKLIFFRTKIMKLIFSPLNSVISFLLKLIIQPACAQDTIRHQWWVDQSVKGVRLCSFPKLYIGETYLKALHKFFFISSVSDIKIIKSVLLFDFYMHSIRLTFYGRYHYILSAYSRTPHCHCLGCCDSISETGNGKCLGCFDSSRMGHEDSEIGKSLPFWAMVRLGAEGLTPQKSQCASEKALFQAHKMYEFWFFYYFHVLNRLWPKLWLPCTDVLVGGRWRLVQNFRVFRSAEFAGTDHRLLVATLIIRLQSRKMAPSNQLVSAGGRDHN